MFYMIESIALQLKDDLVGQRTLIKNSLIPPLTHLIYSINHFMIHQIFCFFHFLHLINYQIKLVSNLLVLTFELFCFTFLLIFYLFVHLNLFANHRFIAQKFLLLFSTFILHDKKICSELWQHEI